MPVLNGPGCSTSSNCPIILFPKTPTSCFRSFRKGGVNDLYFIPCSESLTLANLLSLAWWAGLLAAGMLGNLGIGIGSIGKKSTTTEKVGSETIAEITGIYWALKYIIKNFDKTSADVTTEQVTDVITRFPNFLLMARMSDGDDTILPIGAFTTSDFDWTVPDDAAQNQSVTLEMSWLEIGLPKMYTVAGLSAILPKVK